MFFAGPRFKAQIHIWGYRLTPASREAELSRLLVESSTTVKEEAQQHDRSPLVPDEATMGAMLAHGMADAMLPKPYQDQYGFSDIMRLTATEVLKRLSFQEEKTEVAENSRKAMALLKKSPYASKLDNAGLFLAQLHAQSNHLRRLISPQLGNQVYFNAQLMQAAPVLQPGNKEQMAALPLGSQLKIDPWTGDVSLMKSRPVSLLSARDKMPFEVTPMVPYLTRHVETSSSQESSHPFAPLN